MLTETALTPKTEVSAVSFVLDVNLEYGHNKYDAITIAEKEVKAKLKSPSTAKFSSSSETSVTRNGNTWRVTGWVDAQNGFGATLRNSYAVKIEFASSDTYTVKECTVS